MSDRIPLNARGYINLISERDGPRYLEAQKEIFSLNKLPITASDTFYQFFQEHISSYNDLSKQDSVARDIEHKHLVKFYRDNGISDTDYELKTKIKSLYISLFTQRTIELQDEKRKGNGEISFFEANRELMLKVLSEQPPVLDALTGQELPKLVPIDEEEITSFTRFYTALKEAQRWQTHAKWDKLAFYSASMSTGEGIFYSPALGEPYLRRKQLFSIVEKIDNKYNKCVKKRKTPIMAPMPMVMFPTSGGAGGVIPAATLFNFGAARSGPTITGRPMASTSIMSGNAGSTGSSTTNINTNKAGELERVIVESDKQVTSVVQEEELRIEQETR